MFWSWIFSVTLSIVAVKVATDALDNVQEPFEMLLGQNVDMRLNKLENIIETLLKDNENLKDISVKQQHDISVLTKIVNEQQRTISKLELKVKVRDDKETQFLRNKSITLEKFRPAIVSLLDTNKDERQDNIKTFSENTVDETTQDNTKIRASRLLEGNVQPTLQPSTIAFYAYMSKEENIAPHHTLIFDHVETNLGGGYNQHTGAFIVPVTGVYLLTYTAFPYSHPSVSSVELAVNSVARGAIFVDSSSVDDDYTGCTGNVVLALNKGDACIVRIHPTYQSTEKINSNELMRTSFTGILISQ